MKKVSNNNLLFTKEQIDHMRELLAEHDNGETGLKNNITLFLIETEQACLTVKKLKNAKDVADHRETLKDIRKHMNQTLRGFDKIFGKGFQLIPQQHLSATTGPGFSDGVKKFIDDTDVFYKAYEHLKKAKELIDVADTILIATTPQKGRPSADPQGLVKEIAISYNRHIDQPIGYASDKSEKSGIFICLISKILEIMELPHKDPSRAIRKAIRDLSS